MNPKLINVMIFTVVFLTVMSWGYKEFDVSTLMFAGQFIFWVFSVLFVVGFLFPITRDALKADQPTRPPDRIACKGSGGDPSGRITAWEGVEPIWADCPVCEKSCTIDEDREKLWVISPHIAART